MTRKASAINNFVEVLLEVAMNGTPIKTARAGMNDKITVEAGNKMLADYGRTLKAHMVDIVEGNEEQAEAVLAELKIVWSNGNPNRPKAT